MMNLDQLLTMWTIILEFVYVATCVVIFWCRHDHRLAFIRSLVLVTFGASFRGFNSEPSLSPLLSVLSLGIAFFSNCFFGLSFYLFPTGRLVPRWSGLLIVVWIADWVNSNFFPGTAFNNFWLSFVLFLALIASLIVSQIYRYQRVSSPTQCQQTKRVVFGISLEFGGFVFGLILAFAFLPKFFPVSALAYTLAQLHLYLLLLVFPLSIDFAILRYQLWEIDTQVNRTLVYGTLTDIACPGQRWPCDRSTDVCAPVHGTGIIVSRRHCCLDRRHCRAHSTLAPSPPGHQRPPLLPSKLEQCLNVGNVQRNTPQRSGLESVA